MRRSNNANVDRTMRVKSMIPLDIRREVADMRWSSDLTDKEIAIIVNNRHNLNGAYRVFVWYVRVICIEFYGKYKTTTKRTRLVSDTKPIGDTTEYKYISYRCHPDVFEMLLESRIPHSDFINTVMRYYKSKVFDREKKKQTRELLKDMPRYF